MLCHVFLEVSPGNCWLCLSFGCPKVDSLSTMNVTGRWWNEKGEDFSAAALIKPDFPRQCVGGSV